MPKVKTHKSAVKRFRRSGTGLIIGRRLSIAHRARFKSKRAKKLSGQTQVIFQGLAKKLRKVIQ